MGEDAFTAVMASADPAMIVVTTVAESERAGCLVGFHAQSGITPERYCIWLSKANHTYRVGLRATDFAIHFLTPADLDLAERFGTLTGEDTDKFSGLDVQPDERGLPLLADCPQRLLVERIALLDDGADHVCLTTRVRSAQLPGPFEPLRLSAVAHLRAGRDSDDRAIHP